MPVAPSPKKVPARRVAHEGRAGAVDLFSVVAGLVLCSGIGYVAYRTQLRGEPIERVFPFLAEDRRRVAPAGPATAEAGPGTHSGNVAKPAAPAGDGKDDTPQDDPDNTYFGRRVHGRTPAAPR